MFVLFNCSQAYTYFIFVFIVLYIFVFIVYNFIRRNPPAVLGDHFGEIDEGKKIQSNLGVLKSRELDSFDSE